MFARDVPHRATTQAQGLGHSPALRKVLCTLPVTSAPMKAPSAPVPLSLWSSEKGTFILGLAAQQVSRHTRDNSSFINCHEREREVRVKAQMKGFCDSVCHSTQRSPWTRCVTTKTCSRRKTLSLAPGGGFSTHSRKTAGTLRPGSCPCGRTAAQRSHSLPCEGHPGLSPRTLPRWVSPGSYPPSRNEAHVAACSSPEKALSQTQSESLQAPHCPQEIPREKAAGERIRPFCAFQNPVSQLSGRCRQAGWTCPFA